MKRTHVRGGELDTSDIGGNDIFLVTETLWGLGVSYSGLLTGRRLTEVDDMDALGAKLFRSNFSLCDTAIVRIVDDDLSALYGEKVHDLVFELCLDAAPECVGRL